MANEVEPIELLDGIPLYVCRACHADGFDSDIAYKHHTLMEREFPHRGEFGFAGGRIQLHAYMLFNFKLGLELPLLDYPPKSVRLECVRCNHHLGWVVTDKGAGVSNMGHFYRVYTLKATGVKCITRVAM